ncbi:MAG: hypothetical protein EBW87_04315 [Burkholderiaceae bacterium]|nr:hypothetical protein [Burkholderiaceae bacterium]
MSRTVMEPVNYSYEPRTPVIPLADEIDWFPMEWHGYIWHTFVSDEDFCQNTAQRKTLRRMNRKEKLAGRWQ